MSSILHELYFFASERALPLPGWQTLVHQVALQERELESRLGPVEQALFRAFQDSAGNLHQAEGESLFRQGLALGLALGQLIPSEAASRKR